MDCFWYTLHQFTHLRLMSLNVSFSSYFSMIFVIKLSNSNFWRFLHQQRRRRFSHSVIDPIEDEEAMRLNSFLCRSHKQQQQQQHYFIWLAISQRTNHLRVVNKEKRKKLVHRRTQTEQTNRQTNKWPKRSKTNERQRTGGSGTVDKHQKSEVQIRPPEHSLGRLESC